MQSHPAKKKGGGALFILGDSPLTRYQFCAILITCLIILGFDTTYYKSHSCRIGAATTLALRGVSARSFKQQDHGAPGCSSLLFIKCAGVSFGFNSFICLYLLLPQANSHHGFLMQVSVRWHLQLSLEQQFV